MWEGLNRFATMPAWLAALDDPSRVQRALHGAVPGLRRAELSTVRLKPGVWSARCTLVLDGAEPPLHLSARILPSGPGGSTPTRGLPGSHGEDWSCWVPELRLELVSRSEPESELPALALLTDPDQARALLEGAIRAGGSAYRDLRILSVEPRVMRHSPGSRCTILYRLELPDEMRATAWPDMVVAKSYHRSGKGVVAWDGMRALWRSPLAGSKTVAIAEPLAWLPELRTLVQGPIRHERTLKDLLTTTLSSGGPAARDELRAYLAKTAAGLVELHSCGAASTETATLEGELDEAREVLGRLTGILPDLDGAADDFLADLEVLARRIPRDVTLPAHRSFRPAQILLNQGGGIGFIDFDGFCHAEPALDVALFRASTRDLATGVLPPDRPPEARLETVDDMCEHFLAHYEALAPISRERVALWEAVDLFTNVLHSWTKVKPARLANAFTLLRHRADTLIGV